MSSFFYERDMLVYCRWYSKCYTRPLHHMVFFHIHFDTLIFSNSCKSSSPSPSPLCYCLLVGTAVLYPRSHADLVIISWWYCLCDWFCLSLVFTLLCAGSVVEYTCRVSFPHHFNSTSLKSILLENLLWYCATAPLCENRILTNPPPMQCCTHVYKSRIISCTFYLAIYS